MTADLPTWTALDLDVRGTLPTFPPPAGRVVALLASPEAVTAGWGPFLAADLARGWSSAGSRVVLADLGLVHPTLHGALGEPEGEGVTDAVMFGASPRRVARPIDGEAFFMVPAGTVVADAAATLASPRWGSLCQGFRDADVLLGLYLPEGEPGKAATLKVATDVVVLAEAEEDLSGFLADVDLPVRAVLGPSPDSPLRERPERSAVGATAVAESAPAFPQAVPNGTGEPAKVPAERDAVASARKTPSRSRSSTRTTVVLLVVLIAILGILVAAWLGYLQIPGITPSDSSAAVPEEVVPAPATPATPTVRRAPPVPTSSVQGFSVAVAAYRDSAGAWAAVRAIERFASGAIVTAVPVRVDGTLVYRVLIGPAQKPANARALAARIARDSRTSGSRWIVRSTPLAFRLGDVDGRAAADQRAEALRGLGIPAYVMAVDFSDGSTTYRVYAGAFADANEASYLRERLAARSLGDAALTNRIGRLPE